MPRLTNPGVLWDGKFFYVHEVHAEVADIGQLCDISIQVRNDPGLPNNAHRAVDVIALEICVKEVGEGFWVRYAQGELFACLTKKVAQGLKRLERLTRECVQVEGVMSSAAFREASLMWKKSGKSATTIDVNIYGHPHSAKAVRGSAVQTWSFESHYT